MAETVVEATATEVVETVAGVLCPCGHRVEHHGPAGGEFAGERYGACQGRSCGCKGLIDVEAEEL